MFWEKELEEIERKTLAALQVKRLNNTLRQAVTAGLDALAVREGVKGVFVLTFPSTNVCSNISATLS